MGLSIYYNGSFKKDASLEEMVGELEDISKIYGWEYHIFETKFPENGFKKINHNGKLYGICFTPPGSETVTVSFLSNGRMSGPAQLQFYGNSKKKKEREYLYMLFVKTQFAGSEIHMLIIHLLKYLDKKYLTDFKLVDDGQYWETGDQELLRETFKRYNQLIGSFASSLEMIPMNSNENLDSYLVRIAKIIHANNTGNKK